jgi:hypothetical protein
MIFINRVARISVYTVLCLCLISCFGTGTSISTYIVSSASIETGDVTISKAGKFSLGGVEVFIKPVNQLYSGSGYEVLYVPVPEERDPKNYFFSPVYYVNPKLDTRDPFVVEIRIATGDHDTTFNPVRLVLQSEKFGKSASVGYYKLIPRYKSTLIHDPVTPLCKPPQGEFRMGHPWLTPFESKSNDPVPLAKNGTYCFAVKFDIPPVDPRTIFTITIDDFSVDGRKIIIPPIFYKPDTYTQPHRV